MHNAWQSGIKVLRWEGAWGCCPKQSSSTDESIGSAFPGGRVSFWYFVWLAGCFWGVVLICVCSRQILCYTTRSTRSGKATASFLESSSPVSTN